MVGVVSVVVPVRVVDDVTVEVVKSSVMCFKKYLSSTLHQLLPVEVDVAVRVVDEVTVEVDVAVRVVEEVTVKVYK